MYIVYILKSQKNGRYYIGSTNDLDRRMNEHNSGKTKSLKYLRPLQIVFQKKFEAEIDARKVEQRIKKFKSKEILEKIISDANLKIGPMV